MVNNKIKTINGIRISPLFYKKQHFKGALIVAMIGLCGSLISLGRFICLGDSVKHITETDNWEILVISMFLFALFLPLSMTLYFASVVVEILDTALDKSDEIDGKKNT